MKEGTIQCISYKNSSLPQESVRMDSPAMYCKASSKDNSSRSTQKADCGAKGEASGLVHGITEWQLVAMVIDRVGLILYSVTFFVGTIVFLCLFCQD